MHSFKTSGRQIGQCKCRWCGQYGNGGECIPEAVKARVAAFAREHGRTWKSALRSLWTSGKDEGYLRIARNTLGPTGLDGISAVMLSRFAPEAS